MTHNNISYLEVLEKKRSNLAQEKETQRANLAKEENTRYVAHLEDAAKRDIAAADVAVRELVAGINRESQATVAQIQAGASTYATRTNAETQRYIADVNAGVARENLAETSRHNLVSEGVSQSALSETVRHNYETELVGKQDVSVRAAQVENTYEIQQLQTEETERHNRATEWNDFYRIGSNSVTGILRALPGLAGLDAGGTITPDYIYPIDPGVSGFLGP